MDMRRLLLAGLLVGCLGFVSSAHAATLANLWVSTTGGTCTRSAIPTAYLAGASCGSLNAAYAKANAGDLILIKGGTYGDQTIADRTDLAIGSATVTMQIAEGETMTVNGSITISTHDLTLRGAESPAYFGTNARIIINQTTPPDGELDLQIAGGQIGNRNLIVEGVHASSAFITSWGATIRFSEIGPHSPCVAGSAEDLVMIWTTNIGADTGAKNVTIQGNWIHQADDRACPGQAIARHMDAIGQYGSHDGLVVKQNRISWCGTQCIEFSGPTNNVLFENNMVEETPANLCGGCGAPGEVTVDATVTNITIRYNTISGNVNIVGGSASPVFTGNIFLDTMPSCSSGSMNGTFSHNVFHASAGVTCGTNAKRGTPLLSTGRLYSPLTSTTVGADWHLSVSDTVAKGAGDPLSFPVLDIDGQVRPIGLAPYAGANQVGSGAPPSPPTALGVIGQ